MTCRVGFILLPYGSQGSNKVVRLVQKTPLPLNHLSNPSLFLVCI